MMAMTKHAVVIAGGGPTGLMLAIQSSSPLVPEKKPSTVIVTENVSFLTGVLLRPIAT